MDSSVVQGNSFDVEKTALEGKDIDKWLPITANRNAKWWYSTFHNVTAMVGAGVLSLPYAMSELGWYRFFTLIFRYCISDELD